LERAILVDPYDFVARDRLAQAYLGLGKKEEAERQRQQVKEMQMLLADMEKVKQQLMTDPRDAGLHNRLADILESLNRREEAANERRIARLLGASETKSPEKSKSPEKK